CAFGSSPSRAANEGMGKETTNLPSASVVTSTGAPPARTCTSLVPPYSCQYTLPVVFGLKPCPTMTTVSPTVPQILSIPTGSPELPPGGVVCGGTLHGTQIVVAPSCVSVSRVNKSG